MDLRAIGVGDVCIKLCKLLPGTEVASER